jgi:hypothetical protein
MVKRRRLIIAVVSLVVLSGFIWCYKIVRMKKVENSSRLVIDFETGLLEGYLRCQYEIIDTNSNIDIKFDDVHIYLTKSLQPDIDIFANERVNIIDGFSKSNFVFEQDSILAQGFVLRLQKDIYPIIDYKKIYWIANNMYTFKQGKGYSMDKLQSQDTLKVYLWNLVKKVNKSEFKEVLYEDDFVLTHDTIVAEIMLRKVKL